MYINLQISCKNLFPFQLYIDLDNKISIKYKCPVMGKAKQWN